MSKYISIEYDEPHLKPEIHEYRSLRYKQLIKPIRGIKGEGISVRRPRDVIVIYEQELYEQKLQEYKQKMNEYEQKMEEYEQAKKNPYFFQKRTALIDVENKDFNFLDEVDFDYGVSFPQIEIFNQKNRKSLTLTFKDNEQYQTAKSQIIQAIT